MKKNKSIIATLLLTAALGALFIIASGNYYRLEEEACFHTLTEYTSQIAGQIQGNMTACAEHLDSIASILSRVAPADDSEAAQILSSFEHNTMTKRLELLYPDGSLLLSNGRRVSAAGSLSFEEEADAGAHITGQGPDALDPGKIVIRACVPVMSGGKTAALLYSVIDLDTLPELYHADAFEGNTRICLIDGANGDLLADTRSAGASNLYEAVEAGQEYGGNMQALASGIAAGREGTAFLTGPGGEHLYVCYAPVYVNRWMVMLYVPEKIAFASLHRVMLASYCLAALIIVIFAAYFFWMLFTVRKDRYEKESQLTQVRYMLGVEKLLFDAHIKPGQIEKALRKIAETAGAQEAVLLIIENAKTVQMHIWKKDGQESKRQTDGRPLSAGELSCIEALLHGCPSLVCYDMEQFAQQYPEGCAFCRQMGIRSIMLSPVEGMDGHLSGVLAACNMEHRWEDSKLLECVCMSFSMFLHNRAIYRTIRTMGTIDSLTGLLNRNSYHSAIARLEKEGFRSLACIYIDVNGLHEVNNYLGHEAGDQMLCFIADQLSACFPGSAYRIGGDEFVILCQDLDRDTVEAGLRAVLDAAESRHYYLSAGTEWSDSSLNINALIKAADDKMQENKRKFYQARGNERKLREMNQQLEEMITEKKDADAFLSVIASNFLGVYFVNLTEDSVRHIYIPPYFEAMLKRSQGKFSPALSIYAREQVKPDFSEAFSQFCRYEALENMLEQDDVPEFVYQKPDDSWLRLRIFKFKRYTELDRETLWIFEIIERPAGA